MIYLMNAEHVTEQLKERIYANIAILAALVGMDLEKSSHARVAIVIGATALSLWMASIFAIMLSRTIVLHERITISYVIHQLKIHAPILTAPLLPLTTVVLSALGVMSLDQAIRLSMYAILVLMIVWSVLAGRRLHADRWGTVLISCMALTIGLLIAVLKAAAKS